MRNDLFSALRRGAFLSPASLRTCFLAAFILVAIGPSSVARAAANIQYTVIILARIRDYVRLLPTLRADAIGKKLQIRRRCRFGQLHLSRRAKCKGVRFSCERARAS